MNNLIAAPHPPTSAAKAKAAIKAAYAADANAINVFPYGITNAECFDVPDWLFKEAACTIKASNLYKVYKVDGTEAFYVAAFATYSYFINLAVPPRYGTAKTGIDYINKQLRSTWP